MKKYSGTSGWLSWLSLQLQLRSGSHGSWAQPPIKLCVDSSDPGACFGFCVSLCLCPFPAHALSLSVSKLNKTF